MRNWLRRRHAEAERAEARRAELLSEYIAKADAGDPDVAEVSRDFYDNNGAPWSLEVGATAIILGFVVAIAVATASFAGIAYLINY